MTPRSSPSRPVALIAAVAVGAIAINTAILVHHGRASSAAAGPNGAPAACVQTPAAVTVPADTHKDQAAGSFDGAAPQRSAPTDVANAPTGAVSGAGISVRMFFGPGAPPTADLCGIFVVPGGATDDRSRHRTDGTPLGHLSIHEGTPDGARYLWVAVGPEVTQVQLTAALTTSRTPIDTGFSPGQTWTVDSGHGTAWSSPEAGTTVWTDLGHGWHGFAVQLPVNATSVDAFALDPTGAPVQDRTFDLANQRVHDGLLPQFTTPVAPTPTTR